MKNFYLTRLKGKDPSERQAYLDETVVEKYREEVKAAWNAEHPEETLN